MRNTNIDKVFAVWSSINKITKPSDTKLALDIIEHVASLFSAGNFYYYVFNFMDYKMDYVSEGTKNVLGISPEGFTLNKVFSLIHPEDLADMHRKERASVNFKMRKLDIEDITKYKTVYLMRFILDSGEQKTILHQSKAITISKDGKVQQTMGIHTDVTHLDLPIDHKVSFIGYKKPNYYYNAINDSFEIMASLKSKFTNREKQILQELIKGKTANSIAKLFNVSPHTIIAHKKNILKKSNCSNTSELIAKCIREGII